ncbi:MAG: hypothetical protein ABL904_01730 [Hyphomicrobiaceae bacterium]
MKINQNLPSTIQIWITAYLPHAEADAVIPRPNLGGTLWAPPLPFGMTWNGLPVTNTRINTTPDLQAPGLAHFGAELSFKVAKDKTVTAAAKPLTGSASVEFADPNDGKTRGFGRATCRPKIAATAVNTGASWKTTLDFVGSVRLASSLPAIGVNGRFVLAHTHDRLETIVYYGGVLGFPAYECLFTLNNGGNIYTLFQVPSDPIATDDVKMTLGFGRPVFFEANPEPLFKDEFLKLPDGSPGHGNRVKFKDAASVDKYFGDEHGAPFYEWFNKKLKNKGAFGGPYGNSPGKSDIARERLKLLMDSMPRIYETADVTLIQFIALFCIVLRESGGFERRTETAGNSGLAYFYKYDRNKKIGNKKIYDLLADPTFWKGHQDESPKDFYDPAGKDFSKRRGVWKLEAYPGVSKAVDLSVNGYTMQADFCKFIGRGPLQLTGRWNYRSVIRFIQNYNGTDALLSEYQKKWNGKSVDVVATESKVQDWERLFADGQQMPIQSIIEHAKSSGDYLRQLASDPATLRDGAKSARGSLSYMASRVNPSSAYIEVFRARVRDFIDALKLT